MFANTTVVFIFLSVYLYLLVIILKHLLGMYSVI